VRLCSIGNLKPRLVSSWQPEISCQTHKELRFLGAATFFVSLESPSHVSQIRVNHRCLVDIRFQTTNAKEEANTQISVFNYLKRQKNLS
jgi:hypothetical protein